MNKWVCQHRGCGKSVVGCGGALGLRAIGWYFRKGPIIFCPVCRPDGVQCLENPELKACSLCAGGQEAKRFQAMIAAGSDE